MTRRQRKNLIRIGISLVLFLVLFTIDHLFPLDEIIQNEKISWILPASLYCMIYLFIAYDILWKAIRNIFHGQVLDENFLMCIATIGAFAIQSYDEAVAVILFYQVGEFFQNYAVHKSRKSISSLMDIRPDFANVIKDGVITTIDPEEVNLEDIILVNPGEKVPLDGICHRRQPMEKADR